MYVYVCVCSYVYVYVFAFVYVHVYVYVCVYVYVFKMRGGEVRIPSLGGLRVSSVAILAQAILAPREYPKTIMTCTSFPSGHKCTSCDWRGKDDFLTEGDKERPLLGGTLG